MEKLNTVGKAIAIIETISLAARPLSIKEISETMGLNKSSLHHHIKTLTENGYLQQDSETRKYDIGLCLVRVGQSFLQRLNVRESGHRYLSTLSDTVGQTVHMLVLDGAEAVYVDKIDATRGALKFSSYIGLRTDLYSTASGKVLLGHQEPAMLAQILPQINMVPITSATNTDMDVLLAELVETKARGFGLDQEEHERGVQCISVPVFNQASQCVAAISVSRPIATASAESLETEVLHHLQATALEISRSLGYTP